MQTIPLELLIVSAAQPRLCEKGKFLYFYFHSNTLSSPMPVLSNCGQIIIFSVVIRSLFIFTVCFIDFATEALLCGWMYRHLHALHVL